MVVSCIGKEIAVFVGADQNDNEGVSFHLLDNI